MARLGPEFDRNVFINCPFDLEYAPLFEAIVFAVHDAGFRPKCARERLDSGEVRLQKIVELIRAWRYSIHDLSRTELDRVTALPRFNMPLELGIDLGCKAFSNAHRGKSLLIFDSEQYRFQKYVSDIGGQDIQRHGNDAKWRLRGCETGFGRNQASPGFLAVARSTKGMSRFAVSCRQSVASSDWTCTTSRLWISLTPSPSGSSDTPDSVGVARREPPLHGGVPPASGRRDGRLAAGATASPCARAAWVS